MTKFYDWVGTEVEKEPDILSCSDGGLFFDMNYTTFDYKKDFLEDILRSRQKYYRLKDIVYDINVKRKVLMILTSAPGNECVGAFVINEGGHINETNIQSSFDIELQYVLTHAEYMRPMKYSTWSVTTWCKLLNYNYVMKKGSENDNALLESSKNRYHADSQTA